MAIMYPTVMDIPPDGFLSKRDQNPQRYTVDVSKREGYASIQLLDNGGWFSDKYLKRVRLRGRWWWVSPWSRVQHYREKFEHIAQRLNEEDEANERAFDGMNR